MNERKRDRKRQRQEKKLKNETLSIIFSAETNSKGRDNVKFYFPL